MFPNSSIGFSQCPVVNWAVVFFLMLWPFLKVLLYWKYDMHKLFSLPPYLFLPLKNIFNMKHSLSLYLSEFSTFVLKFQSWVPMYWVVDVVFFQLNIDLFSILLSCLYMFSGESSLTFTFIYLLEELILINYIEVLFIVSSC